MEYAPDVNVSRNVSKRSLGNTFKTKKNAEKIVRKLSTTLSESEDFAMNEGEDDLQSPISRKKVHSTENKRYTLA